MTDSSVSDLRDAVAEAERLVASVRAEQWQAATPCTAWSVRDLVNHLTGSTALFARLLRGEPAPVPAAQEPADHLGDDALRSYRAANTALLDAFAQPGALERVLSVPAGEVTGAVAARLRLVEAIVHGWDLASATGQRAEFDESATERALAFSRDRLAVLPAGRRPFAAPQPVAEESPAIERLAALLGRPVSAPTG